MGKVYRNIKVDRVEFKGPQSTKTVLKKEKVGRFT